MHANPFNLLLSDTGEDGGVCSLTEEQCVTWGAHRTTTHSIVRAKVHH